MSQRQYPRDADDHVAHGVAARDWEGRGESSGAAAGERYSRLPGRDLPSALDIARLSRSRGLAEGRAQLYRHIARLTALGPGEEFLIVPSATGSAARFLASASGAHGVGVDPDPALIEHAAERARVAGIGSLVQFDEGDPRDLPYTDGVFDLAIGEIGLSAVEAEGAVKELGRVVRDGGRVLLVQPVWTADVEEGRKSVLARRLGFRPFLPQRWKVMLRAAGVDDLQAEDLSDVASSRTGAVSIRTLTDFFTVRDRFAVAFAAFRRWGWPGIAAAVGREQVLRRLVSRERVLGLSLIWGTRRRRPGSHAAVEGEQRS
jgi:SAM-dependent methyltransferase